MKSLFQLLIICLVAFSTGCNKDEELDKLYLSGNQRIMLTPTIVDFGQPVPGEEIVRSTNIVFGGFFGETATFTSSNESLVMPAVNSIEASGPYLLQIIYKPTTASDMLNETITIKAGNKEATISLRNILTMPQGEGTLQKPYKPYDVVNYLFDTNNAEDVWIEGFIAGAKGEGLSMSENAKDNILLADDTTASKVLEMLTVELEEQTVLQTYYNTADYPELKWAKVKLKGTISSLNGNIAIKSLSDVEILSSQPFIRVLLSEPKVDFIANVSEVVNTQVTVRMVNSTTATASIETTPSNFSFGEGEALYTIDAQGDKDAFLSLPLYYKGAASELTENDMVKIVANEDTTSINLKGSTYVFDAMTLSELKSSGVGAEIRKKQLKPLTVVYADANALYLTDNTEGIKLYTEGANYNLSYTPGDEISVNLFEFTLNEVNNLFQIEGEFSISKTGTTVLAPLEVSLDDLVANASAYQSMLVEVKSSVGMQIEESSFVLDMKDGNIFPYLLRPGEVPPAGRGNFSAIVVGTEEGFALMTRGESDVANMTEDPYRITTSLSNVELFLKLDEKLLEVDFVGFDQSEVTLSIVDPVTDLTASFIDNQIKLSAKDFRIPDGANPVLKIMGSKLIGNDVLEYVKLIPISMEYSNLVSLHGYAIKSNAIGTGNKAAGSFNLGSVVKGDDPGYVPHGTFICLIHNKGTTLDPEKVGAIMNSPNIDNVFFAPYLTVMNKECRYKLMDVEADEELGEYYDVLPTNSEPTKLSMPQEGGEEVKFYFWNRVDDVDVTGDEITAPRGQTLYKRSSMNTWLQSDDDGVTGNDLNYASIDPAKIPDLKAEGYEHPVFIWQWAQNGGKFNVGKVANSFMLLYVP